ncbi:hypothetical protein niasHS_003169 [Heterodera schachtii]|uniref:Uncharacterized protein n=1 Tax=Heterodera schachtii TaxID=97005 RepID=A0ABD2KFQ5_HETSC
MSDRKCPKMTLKKWSANVRGANVRPHLSGRKCPIFSRPQMSGPQMSGPQIAATPGATLFGSWHVLFGNQDQVVNLWRYQNGYPDLDRFPHIRALSSNTSVKSAELDYTWLCLRRRTVITKPFSYWGEPREREPSHVYDLRSYVLKVAGFFSQQLYMVFHIWAYPPMMDVTPRVS